MKLRNRIKITSPYKGSSKFDFWKNLKVDDIVTVETKIDKSHTSGYASELHLVNTRTKEKINVSFSIFVNYFKTIEYEETN